MIENFIGQTFAWFTGVIEDIQDPKEMGRVKVRCYGYHNDDKVEVPTEELPWATPMLPVTSASMTEVGQSATGLLQGSWVVGFFRDGPNAQDPIILGSIPAISSAVNYQKGFTDPDERYPAPNKLDIAETPLAAKSLEEAYKQSFPYVKKNELRTTYDPKITIAQKTRAPEKVGTLPQQWIFPDIDSVIAPQYPKNHVIAYEKADDALEDAHTVEFDVTPGQERISTIHRTGTYSEITPIGDKTEVIVGKNYRVVAQGENVYIEGGCNLTIDGGCNTKIIGDWNVQVTGNKYEHIGGEHVHKVKKNQTIDIDGSQVIDIVGSITETTGDEVKEDYGGNQTTNAPNIFLN